MRVISLPLLIGIVGLLVIAPAGQFIPLVHTRAGSFTLPTSGSYIKSIECDSGEIVVIQFSADIGALEFFLVHSDFYDLAGLPEISLCQYHTFAQSAIHQFTTARSGLWYLVFVNSPQNQQVSYVWTEYSAVEWNFIQYRDWAIILGSIVVTLIVIIRFAKSRSAEKM